MTPKKDFLNRIKKFKFKSVEFVPISAYNGIGIDKLMDTISSITIEDKKEKIFLISKSNKSFFENYDKVDKIWFQMVGHIPVIKVKIGKRRYYFGIDTGAEINVIDKRLRKRLPKDMIASDYLGQIIGSNNNQIKVNRVHVKKMKIGKSNYRNQPFTFADLSFLQGENGIQLDGLLGYQFLKEALFSINYKKKQLYKWLN